MLCTTEDVRARLTDDVEVTDERINSLAVDAEALIYGYLGSVPHPTPDVLSIVAARMVARTVSRGVNTDAAADSFSQQAGPFSVTTHYASDSLGGGVWLSSQDKLALRPYRTTRGIVSVDFC